MNTYNIIVLVSALVILGLSIWAFMTRCNTDKFGDDSCIDPLKCGDNCPPCYNDNNCCNSSYSICDPTSNQCIQG